VLLTLSMDTHNLIIRVQDEGIGIPADETEQIYELFYQGSNIGAIGGKGRGMGLKFVRDSVRAHDGKIEVQSTLNKGTTFTVTLSPQPIKRIQ
jgi:two-component system phosphate regulon sensor histidine kinase PhoR